MRNFSADFAGHIASGETTLAQCWKLTRRDGVTLGFTDHDDPLSFDDILFAPMHGLEGSEMGAKLGAQVDTGEVIGILHSDAITEADIARGAYDGANVESWRVNWRDPRQRALLRRATIGEITREDGRFRAELRSGQQALNRVAGRIYAPLCDAVLGDARCKVAADHPQFGAGCDRMLATCRARFGNVANFRGFPHIPGSDYLLKYPKTGEPAEGAALFR